MKTLEKVVSFLEEEKVRLCELRDSSLSPHNNRNHIEVANNEMEATNCGKGLEFIHHLLSRIDTKGSSLFGDMLPKGPNHIDNTSQLNDHLYKEFCNVISQIDEDDIHSSDGWCIGLCTKLRIIQAILFG